MGQFLFSADDVFKSVDVLSGGRKSTFIFRKTVTGTCKSLLILDEPTNHLDIPGKEALEESLKDFTGSILFVSHDRYFIQQLATGLIRFEDGKAEFIDQTYDEYMQSEDAKPVLSSSHEEETQATSEATRRQISPEARKGTRKTGKTD